MKFTKPINRDVDINDQTYVVTLDESGLTFRIKGKRKSTQVGWTEVLAIAGESSQGGSQQESSGGASTNASGSQNEARGASAQGGYNTRPFGNEDEGVEATTDNDAELRHAAGVGDRSSES